MFIGVLIGAESRDLVGGLVAGGSLGHYGATELRFSSLWSRVEVQ